MGSFDAYEKRFRGRNKENIESSYKTKVNIRFQNRGGGNYKKVKKCIVICATKIIMLQRIVDLNARDA